MPEAIIGDFRMHYEADDFTDPWVKSETILMHHGFARNSRLWYRMVPLLARDFRVVRLDARGFGQSEVPPPDYSWSLEGFARDAKGLLDYLGIDQVIWVGELFGNGVGLRFAYDYPERTRALALCHPVCNIEERKDLPVVADYDFRAMDEALDGGGVKAWALPRVNNRLDTRKASPELIDWVNDEMNKTSVQVAKILWRQVRGMLASVPDILPYVQAPTLLLSGALSPNCTPAHVEFMTMHLPNSEVVMFEDIGSGIWLLIPEQCVQAIRQFVKKLP